MCILLSYLTVYESGYGVIKYIKTAVTVLRSFAKRSSNKQLILQLVISILAFSFYLLALKGL